MLYAVVMVRVAERDKVRIYVYGNEAVQPHHLAHCHVYWPDGSAVVALDNLAVLRGDDVPARARRLLEEHIAAAREAWEAQNGTTGV